MRSEKHTRNEQSRACSGGFSEIFSALIERRFLDGVFGVMEQKRFKLDRNHAAHYLVQRAGLSICDAYAAVDMLCDFIYDSVCVGFDVHFRQLGTFRLQRHKGHAVQFGATQPMNPYPVLKFKPMVSVSHKLRAQDGEGTIMWDIPADLEIPDSGLTGDERIEEVLAIRQARIDHMVAAAIGE